MAQAQEVNFWNNMYKVVPRMPGMHTIYDVQGCGGERVREEDLQGDDQQHMGCVWVRCVNFATLKGSRSAPQSLITLPETE